MENTQRVRRRQRRREWSVVELAFFGLAVLLALMMTVSGLIHLAGVFSGGKEKEPLQTVTVGGGQTGEEGDSEEDSQKPDQIPVTDSDLTQYANDAGYGGKLYKLMDSHPEAAYILRNLELYPEDLLAFITRFPEAMAYGAAYLDYDRMGIQPSNDLSDPDSRHSTVDSAVQSILDSQGVMPLLLQWDSRWGYQDYGDGMLGCTGCGPTCLSMVSLYLTGWHDNDPYSIAQYAQENGYYISGSGSAWTLMSQASANFGVVATELPLDENKIISALEEDHPVICAMGPGNFTDNGHYIILAGYSDGAFLIRDPNSPSNSMRSWTFEEIKDQIKNIWSFEAINNN
ncbi:MAG: C39 family peptidase [Candidatus Onthomonas sp.]